MLRISAGGRLAPVILATVLALGYSSVPNVASSAPAQDTDPEFLGGVDTSFSPNGDGVKDHARLRYRLPTSSQVRIRVTLNLGVRRPVFTTSLGRRSAGVHTWTWDGTAPGGRKVRDGVYRLEVLTSTGADETYVALARRFRARVIPHGYTGLRSETLAIYPRSRTVEDSLELLGIPGEVVGNRRASLKIADDAGHVVARHQLPTHPRSDDPPFVWTARDHAGRPLAPGRYLAYVTGVDRAGNTGRGRPLRLWVSKERLRWVKETRTVRARNSAADLCHYKYCEADAYCGTVRPSRQLREGLTHLAGVCDDPFRTRAIAESTHFLPIEGAVRGVAALKVGFTGTPTVPGETDPGIVEVHSSELGYSEVASSSSAAQTQWVENPAYGQGGVSGEFEELRIPSGAMWRFRTEGTNAFDVGRFTVKVRYLGIRGR